MKSKALDSVNKQLTEAQKTIKLLSKKILKANAETKKFKEQAERFSKIVEEFEEFEENES